MAKAIRSQYISFRLTRAERLRVSRLRRKDETIHQTARRVLLGATGDLPFVVLPNPSSTSESSGSQNEPITMQFIAHQS